jgi:sugar phosphate isomerase/epimerase
MNARTRLLTVVLTSLLTASAHLGAEEKAARPLNTPPEGYVALFNGKDLSGWKGLVANPKERAQMSEKELAQAQEKADARMRASWTVVDGVLVFSGKGDSLCTAKDYTDFDLYVDWKIKPNGDSGIYLRGSPQVQIWDPGQRKVGSGGLYNNQKNPSKPSRIADRPIGEWNTFRIRMVGEKVRVWLNSELVVDNVTMENYWERDKPIYPSGQIELQNHGNTLWFRNIYIKELNTATGQPACKPPLYGFCVGMPFPDGPSIPEQAKMLRELGFDGIGFALKFDQQFDDSLRSIDAAGLPLHLVHVSVNVKPGSPPYDPGLPAAIAKLKGRPVTISVLLRGLKRGDPSGKEPAVKVLRELGDLAAEAGLRVSIYHHTGDWTESLIDAISVVEKANHPRVGVNFNLCHWLKIDGEKDYRPVLRAHAKKIFAVTLNGAEVGSDTWTNGLIQPLDQGDFDNRELLKILGEIGYEGPIGLMCYGIPGDPREYLKRSMKVWKTWHRAQ